MDDLISRQAAIDALERTKEKDPKGDIARFYNAITDRKIAVIEDLPSAERKRGKWVRVEDENGDFLCWECSECGDRYVMPYHRASYCPNCGAETRGEEG